MLKMIAQNDAFVEVTFRKIPNLKLPNDWSFEVRLNSKRIAHGVTELDIFGELLETILEPYLVDFRLRQRQ
jgi:hypothetical protein